VIKHNHTKFIELRQKFESITFETFNCSENESGIRAEFIFKLGDHTVFKPTLYLSYKPMFSKKLKEKDLALFIFHIGMVELISYWKIACPAEIIIKPYKLNDQQKEFWKKLYFKGLGEFFYTNDISTSFEEFVTIKSDTEKPLPEIPKSELEYRRVLVPVGGGKDSIVTLELLKSNFQVIPFVVNPIKASLNTIEIAGFTREKVIEVHRTIDPLLLEFNKQGYLNGHTPFSALLAFISLLAATLTGAKNIALSNESSANEPTTMSGANHQYSKSFEFEMDFRNYYKKNISDEINYFSFLRPLNEYRIASLFSRFSQYFEVFRSCNVGSKTGDWCGTCPKCLFAYIILSPFIDKSNLSEIFGYDLFTNKELEKTLDELTGILPEKPFECVGTVDEVNAALQIVIENYQGKLPVLLHHYQAIKQKPSYEFALQTVEQAFDDNHFLDGHFLKILKSALHV